MKERMGIVAGMAGIGMLLFIGLLGTMLAWAAMVEVQGAVRP